MTRDSSDKAAATPEERVRYFERKRISCRFDSERTGAAKALGMMGVEGQDKQKMLEAGALAL